MNSAQFLSCIFSILLKLVFYFPSYSAKKTFTNATSPVARWTLIWHGQFPCRVFFVSSKPCCSLEILAKSQDFSSSERKDFFLLLRWRFGRNTYWVPQMLEETAWNFEKPSKEQEGRKFGKDRVARYNCLNKIPHVKAQSTMVFDNLGRF